MPQRRYPVAKKATKPQPCGRRVKSATITSAFRTAPTMIHGLNFPLLKWVFSMIMPISASLIASQIRQTTMAAEITPNWATVSFMVYWT